MGLGWHHAGASRTAGIDEVFAELGDGIEREDRGTITISYESLTTHPVHSRCGCWWNTRGTRQEVDRLVDRRIVPAIVEARRLIHSAIWQQIKRADFLCGVAPNFVGVSEYTVTVDGRNYADTAHVLYPMHQPRLPRSRRVTTVCLPLEVESWAVVHELGHVLHEALEFEPAPRPVDDYAATNSHEAFARAFDAWIMPYLWPAERARLEEDPETVMLFRTLQRS